MDGLDATALRGLHRFGLGLRPGDEARLDDPRALMLHEAESRTVPVVEGDDLGTTMSLARAFYVYDADRTARLKADRKKIAEAARLAAMDDGMEMAMEPPPAAAKPAGKAEKPYPTQVYHTEIAARFDTARTAPVGFGERLTQFWSNHFCLSINKGAILRTFAGAYEREAIRPHVFGRFEDMLFAVETHPAMLIYLDNQRSIGPNSPAGRKRGRGLNENLAREILELHTLGVNGGYSQADVTAFAAVITGWMAAGERQPPEEQGGFLFNENTHEPGDKTVLGKVYPEGGVEQGRSVLRDLAAHPATADHIALKLARWFVADDPPKGLVARLAETFRKTDGDLGAVSAALITDEESWSAPAAKIRTPQEFLVAASRAIDRSFSVSQIGLALRAMGQPLWQPRGPNGYPSDVVALTTPDVLQARLDVSAQFANQAKDVTDPRAWTEAILGPLLSKDTRQAVARTESRQQGVALMLMSPEFQRR